MNFHLFSKRLKVLIKNKFDVNIMFTIQQLKSTHPFLIANVYKFTCSCDTNITYIGMTTPHLGVREAFAFKKGFGSIETTLMNIFLIIFRFLKHAIHTQHSTKLEAKLNIIQNSTPNYMPMVLFLLLNVFSSLMLV